MSARVSRETEQLEAYKKLVLKWNRSISLISRRKPGETLERLIEDSIEASRKLPEHIRNLVDIGSGNGIPGVVLAIMKPELHVSLVERSRKKSMFLEAVIRGLALKNAVVVNDDYQNAELTTGGPTGVTAIGIDIYKQIQVTLWPKLQPYDGLLLFVDQELAANLTRHVSCGTYWWDPLVGNKMSGLLWMEK